MNMVGTSINKIDVYVFRFGIFPDVSKELISYRIIQKGKTVFC